MVRSAVASDVDEWFRNETVVVRQKGAVFEGDFKLLDFSPSNNPAWRQGTSLPDTSRMLRDMMQWTEQYMALSVEPAVLPAFRKHLAGRFIFFNNKAEGTGLEDEGDTLQLLSKSNADLPDRKCREVLQMREAMCFLQKL